MIHVKWDELTYLMEIFGIERTNVRWQFHEEDTFSLSREVEKFLWQAEEKAGLLVRENQEPNPDMNYIRLQHALSSLYYDRLEDTRYGLDYTVELRSHKMIVTEETFPNLFLFIFRIPREKGFGLDPENHDSGYHIHYVKINSHRNQRTDAIFTFDPKEPATPKPVLFWEQHHKSAHVHVDPGSFGDHRRKAIYDTCTPFLHEVSKHEFKTPSNNASKFHP